MTRGQAGGFVEEGERQPNCQTVKHCFKCLNALNCPWLHYPDVQETHFPVLGWARTQTIFHRDIWSIEKRRFLFPTHYLPSAENKCWRPYTGNQSTEEMWRERREREHRNTSAMRNEITITLLIIQSLGEGLAGVYREGSGWRWPCTEEFVHLHVATHLSWCTRKNSESHTASEYSSPQSSHPKLLFIPFSDRIHLLVIRSGMKIFVETVPHPFPKKWGY